MLTKNNTVEEDNNVQENNALTNIQINMGSEQVKALKKQFDDLMIPVTNSDDVYNKAKQFFEGVSNFLQALNDLKII